MAKSTTIAKPAAKKTPAKSRSKAAQPVVETTTETVAPAIDYNKERNRIMLSTGLSLTNAQIDKRLGRK